MSEPFNPFGNDLFGEAVKPTTRATLLDRFLIPPFTLLDARQGYWQERKRAWLALGIKSEIGRGGGADSGYSLRRNGDEGRPMGRDDEDGTRQCGNAAMRQCGNAAIVNQQAMKKIMQSKRNYHPAEVRVQPVITPNDNAEMVQEKQ